MARIKKTRRNLPSLSRKPPNKPPAPSSSEDDIVSGTVTPVTTPEDSDASSVQHSESSRAEHSPYFESLIDSSSSHNSIAPEGSRKSTPEASSEGGGDSTPPAGTFGGRSCSLVNSLHNKPHKEARREPAPSTSGRDEPTSSLPDRPLSSGQGNKRRAKRKKSQPENSRRKYYRPGRKERNEIRKYQSSWNLLIPKFPFQRLVREITYSITRCPDLKYQGLALEALHEAAEAFLVGLFEDSYLLTFAAKRITLMIRDVQLALRIKGGI